MKPAPAKCLAILLLLVLPPLAVIWLQGEPLAPYLEFPPRMPPRAQSGFSWPAFLLLSLLVAAAGAPLVRRLLCPRSTPVPVRPRHPFPWWGWAGLALIALFWPLAWSRFPWFAPFQAHTFLPLWLGYILTVNGLLLRRRGKSPLTADLPFFLALFPASALFWWYFEYLNRFVGNWQYQGVDNFTAGGYVLQASLSFSTVLPAVLSTTAWLSAFPRLARPLRGMRPVRPGRPRLAGWLLLAAATGGLGATAAFPGYLFPLVWIAPLLIIGAVQAIAGRQTVFARLAVGDWRPVWLPALAALFCGIFWELWNYKSFAHWEYWVPLVGEPKIFEMPLLGYAGYLPFGLECLAIVDLLREFAPGREIRFFYDE